jgi:hypothetical protein
MSETAVVQVRKEIALKILRDWGVVNVFLKIMEE